MGMYFTQRHSRCTYASTGFRRLVQSQLILDTIITAELLNPFDNWTAYKKGVTLLH